jgi:hypothetical protein
MSASDNTELVALMKEQIAETNRARHAVRAISRFVLIFVTYQVFTALVVGIGLGWGTWFGDGWAFFFFAGVISLVGLVHSLGAGYSELNVSERPANTPPRAESISTRPNAPEKDARGLYPGICSCTKGERRVFAGVADVDIDARLLHGKKNWQFDNINANWLS